MNSRSVKHRWFYRASTARLAAVSIGFGIAVWILLAAMDLLAPLYTDFIAVPMATSDAIVGLACGALLFRLMFSERARHQQVVARLRMIAEVNHHIRNALDRIELTAHVTQNQQLIADIDGGVDRIQWALRELLPEAESDELT